MRDRSVRDAVNNCDKVGSDDVKMHTNLGVYILVNRLSYCIINSATFKKHMPFINTIGETGASCYNF